MEREYQIRNDGYGYLSAQFPETYPESHLETGVTDTMLRKKIDAILKTLTLDEKITLLSADGIMGQDTSAMTIDKSYGTGYWAGAARVGIPVMRCYDGPMGVIGNSGFETTRPSSEISLACTFDRELAERYGALYARDNRASAGNMQLGIQTDLVRTLSTERARDMFGEDWFLTGQMGSAMAKGLEENHVLACLKHCGGMGNIDEQTMMENQLSIYEQIFRQDNTAHTVMTNYGSTNGQQACADSYVLQKVFRELWAWKGIVLTDWGGNYQFTADKGVTLETPSDSYNNPETVKRALAEGTMTEADIDEAVGQNLYAMGKIGYLGLVQISRDGTAAVDMNPVKAIEIGEITDEVQRRALQEQNSREALEIAQAGMVLLKNREKTLPLKASEKVVLLGPGAVHTVAGHMHECSFGWLKDLAVSPCDALSGQISDVEAYTAYDNLGTAVSAEYLFTDAACTTHGAVRTGTDGDGTAVSCVDETIDFVTNTTDYRNGPDGGAFPYGTQGAKFTWTTYLKAPETGKYILKAEAMAATEIEAHIEINGEKKLLGSAGGKISSGFFGSTGLVSSKTGLDIPTGPSPHGGPFGLPPMEPDGETPPNMPPFMMKPIGVVEFELESGKVYPITLSVNGHIPEAYDYQIGKKDLQVRLAWVTPSQSARNYESAVRAAGVPDSAVVLFAHELDHLELEARQKTLLDDAIAAAKVAGNRVVLVLSTALPVDISRWEADCDAIVAAWLPGQAGGMAIANVLSGAYAPTGRLCVTWPRNFNTDQQKLNSKGRGVLVKASHPGANVPTEIREGIFCGYKWYDAAGREADVLFPFGYGLSYAEFEDTLVSAIPASAGADETGFDVTVHIKNTGTVPGAEVVQLYICAPEEGLVEHAVYRPQAVTDSFRYVDEQGNTTEDMQSAAYFPQIDGVQFAKRQLCGFAKTPVLEPGEETDVSIHVWQRSLSYWNTSAADYTLRADGTKDKWVTVLGSRTLVLENGTKGEVARTVVSVAPAAASGVQTDAPAQVRAGEVFKITVSTPKDVIGVQLETQDGIVLPLENMNILRAESGTHWELYLRLNQPGAYALALQQKTWDGWQTTGMTLEIRSVSVPPEILAFAAKQEVIHQGERLELTCHVTSNIDAIQLEDEQGHPLTVQETTRRLLPDGTVEISFQGIASKSGIGQIVRCTAIGRGGMQSESRGRVAVSVL